MRNWIDILNELAIEDFSGGEPESGREMVEVSGICWYENTEDQDEVYSSDLPTDITLAIEEHRDSTEMNVRMAIEDVLVSKYGHKHNASPMFYEYKFI